MVERITVALLRTASFPANKKPSIVFQTTEGVIEKQAGDGSRTHDVKLGKLAFYH